MNKYQRVPDDIIDLHRKTVDEAREMLLGLVSGKESRHVRVIVGKGIHSAQGPVLGNFVKKFLTKHCIRYVQAKIQDGGEGALEVFL